MGYKTEKAYDPAEIDSDLFSEEEEALFYSKVNRLPASITGILFGLDTASLIKNICAENGLNEKQSEELTRLIRDVLLGDLYIGDMPSYVSKIGLNQNLAVDISRLVVSRIFSPAIEDIKKIQFEKFGKLPTSSDSQSSPPPRRVAGDELPETGGNIIDLRNQK